jgi:acyl-CoA reductase-like NAD-dependent aldehyde dehydrogenase
MSVHYPLFIPGARGDGGALEVTAPYDGEHLGTVETAGWDALDHALATAHRLYRDRRGWLTPEQRVEVLERAALLVRERSEWLATEAAREGGKPLVDSRVEVARAVDGLKSCAEALRTGAGREVAMGLNAASRGHLAFTHREPVGVVVAVSAFNHPLNLVVHQVGPAVAAGCPVIVKPAEDTPLSGFRLVDILREAGLPEAWCQPVAVGDLTLAERLVTDPRVGFLSFIGSAAVGWRLRARLAPGARCALEHGGAAPVIIHDDADLDGALPLLAKAGFYHAGQVCVSVQRVFAHERVVRRVCEGLTAQAERLRVGDPTLPETEVGPLIRPREVARVDRWVHEAMDTGARLLAGGRRVTDTCYAPTVLFNAAPDARVSCEEVFGPVVSVYLYADLDEAIAQANALPYAFQAAVFTRDLDTALRCYRFLDASAVMVNQTTAFRVDWMPFGGLRASGLGVGGIPYAFREMQNEKLLVLRSGELT